VALKAIFSLLDIGWPLSSEDAGNVNGVSGGGTNAVKVRDKPSANSGIGEVSLYHAELALSIAPSSIELNSLALYHFKFTLMHSIPINVSNNTRVLEIYDGIVNGESRGGRGVENVEVVVLDSRMVKVGGGVCSSVKGNGVLRVSSLVSPYNVSVNSNLPKGDVSRYLVLTILVEEDERVLPHITAVVLTPSSSWMVWVVKLFSELGNVGDMARSGGERDGGIVFSEPNRFVTLNIVV